MRPRAIQSVPGLDSAASPFDRFKQFARMIAAVPKTETENINNSGSAKNGAGGKKQSRPPSGRRGKNADQTR